MRPFLTLILILLGITSCRKDSVDSRDGSPQKRTSEIIEFEDGVEISRSQLEYEGNKLKTKHTSVFNSIQDSLKTEYTYGSNQIELLASTYDGDNWQNDYKYLRTYDTGDNLTGYTFWRWVNNEWNLRNHTEFIFSTQGLHQAKQETYDDGLLISKSQLDYEYTASNVSTRIWTDSTNTEWELFAIDSLFYLNGSLSSWLQSRNPTSQSPSWFLTEYDFIGSQLVGAISYQLSGLVPGDTLSSLNSYLYEEDYGFLTQLTTTDYNGTIQEVKYVYDHAAGNLNQILSHPVPQAFGTPYPH